MKKSRHSATDATSEPESRIPVRDLFSVLPESYVISVGCGADILAAREGLLSAITRTACLGRIFLWRCSRVSGQTSRTPSTSASLADRTILARAEARADAALPFEERVVVHRLHRGFAARARSSEFGLSAATTQSDI